MLTRRRFLSGSCALGAVAAASPLMSSASIATGGDSPSYRAIVCILLGGGNDSFNMLVPYGKRQYKRYQMVRGELALDRHELLELPNNGAATASLALHPGMPELHELYAAGHASFLANVGALRRPLIAKAAHKSLPDNPLGHTAQIGEWQSCSPRPAETGWAGRIADLMQGTASKIDLAMNLSVSGANILQLGTLTAPAQLDSGSSRCPQIPAGVDFQYLNNQMASRLENPESASARRRSTYLQRRSQHNTLRAVARAPALPQELSTLFADDPLSRRLSEVAKVIAARDATTARRQIFFVQFDGWDHHHRLLQNQATMLPMLSRGLKAFRDTLQNLDVLDDVTTFTVSEFGRSLTSNGSGSDHGWAGNQILIGGAINGGKVLGDFPDLTADSPVHLKDGIIAPTTANDEYFAELALWLGLPRAGLGYVLPNLATLKARRAATKPLGLFF